MLKCTSENQLMTTNHYTKIDGYEALRICGEMILDLIVILCAYMT